MFDGRGFDERYRTRSRSRGTTRWAWRCTRACRSKTSSVTRPDEPDDRRPRSPSAGRPCRSSTCTPSGRPRASTAHRTSRRRVCVTRRGPCPAAGRRRRFQRDAVQPHHAPDGGLGLDSAHERRGRGLAVTWPNGEPILPPIRHRPCARRRHDRRARRPRAARRRARITDRSSPTSRS